MPAVAPRSPVSAPSADIRPGTVVTAAAAAAIAAGAALASLTYGWSYTVVTLVGAAAAAALAWLAWRRCPPARIADRGALLLALTLALALFAVCAADVLDWRPFGIDDATAGLAIGFALLVAMPCRYALGRADVMPGAAGLTATALVLALLAWAVLLDDPRVVRFDDLEEAALLQLPARATTVLVAGLAYLYALRRGLYGTALIVLAVVGIACAGTWSAGRMGAFAAACAGGLAVAALAPALVLRRRADAGRPLASVEPLAVPVAALCAAAFAAGFRDAGVVALAAALAAWWFYLRRRVRRAAAGEFSPVSGVQLVLRAGLAGGLAATVYAHALVIEAARSNYTGPMLLAELRDRGLYTVSDFTFARALLRDQYLWRDELPLAPRVAASPEQLIEASRHRRDGWSTAMPLARDLRREALETRGYGFQLRTEDDGRLRVVDVVTGSPAHAAGVRRGDVLRAVDGFTPDRLREARAARTGDAARLELGAPDGTVREATLRESRYRIPAVAAEAVVKAGDRRVGYVALRHFSASTPSEFEAAALRLRRLRVDDLVLDLRLNGGGSLDAAGRVASVIAGRRVDGRTFLRMVYNERHRDSDQEQVFGAPAWGGLGLARIVVITSRETCSASEALVQGLAPHLEVVTVGDTTCGKPVGFQVVRYGDTTYWVVTFKDLNARGEGDYFAGLAPDCPAADDAVHALGDPRDPSFATALRYLAYGRCAPPA